jgi:hypothetical protein
LDTNGAAVQPGVVTYPTSSPNVTSVGGTVFYGTPGSTSNGNDTPVTGRSLEYGWTFSGGGISQAYQQPGYQQDAGLNIITGPCVTDPSTGNSYVQESKIPPTSCRAVPDISAQSGDIVSNGYNIVSAGTDTASGGTSLSSPLSMGMWARIQAAAPAKVVGGNTTYPGNGFANPILYSTASAGGTYDANGDFFDVGGASTETIVTNNGLYATHPGYDEVTGLGVMDVNNLLRDIDHGSTPVNNVCSQCGSTSSGGGGGGSTGGGTPPPESTAACYPLFTGIPGNDNFEPPVNTGGNNGKNPQVNILQGDLHVVQLDPTTHQPTPGGTEYLEAVLTIRDLTDAPVTYDGAPIASSYNQYYLAWTVGGTTYFANASVDTTASIAAGSPQVTYGNGTLVTVGTDTEYQQSAGTGDFGTFNQGPGGTVDIYVPLNAANIGATTPGTVLSAPHGLTFVEIGNSNAGGLLEPADSAGPHYDYILGEVCAATGLPGSNGGSGTPGSGVPEVPTPLAFLGVSGLIGVGVVTRRRRHQLHLI